MFEEYLGQHLKNRHKYIGLKYAKQHGYPELISPVSYGICFKDRYNEQGVREYLVFQVFYESEPVYINGKHIPGRSIKTITEVELFGEGYSSSELEEAKKIAEEYLECAVEKTQVP